MCTVSAVGDAWRQDFPERWPHTYPSSGSGGINITGVSRQEFEALKAEVEQLRILLKAAKAFDEATGQPDCEVDEKVELIKRVAEAVGVDLEDVFGNT